MADRRPLSLVGGVPAELPVADRLRAAGLIINGPAAVDTNLTVSGQATFGPNVLATSISGSISDVYSTYRASNFYIFTNYSIGSGSTNYVNTYSTIVTAGGRLYRGGEHHFQTSAAASLLRINGTSVSVWITLAPATDNAVTLGTASLRWSTVYAASGTISTSDANDKTAPTPIDDTLLDAWAHVRWVQFQFVDAVEAKGGDRARYHWGVVAQQLRDVFAEHGIDGRRYGVLCFDSWDAVEEVRTPAVPAREAVPAVEGVPEITDEYGTVLSWAIEPQAEIPATPGMPERIEVEARAAGSRWGIRYDLAQAIEAAFQRRRADRMEARLAAIEAALGKDDAA